MLVLIVVIVVFTFTAMALFGAQLEPLSNPIEAIDSIMGLTVRTCVRGLLRILSRKCQKTRPRIGRNELYKERA